MTTSGRYSIANTSFDHYRSHANRWMIKGILAYPSSRIETQKSNSEIFLAIPLIVGF